MKLLNRSLFLYVMVFLIGCSGISVQTDHDPKYPFTTLKVYEWHSVTKGPHISHTDAQRVRRAVNRELAAKGYSFATGTADFLINMELGSSQETIVTGPPDSLDRFSGGPGPSPRPLVSHDRGTLALEFVDRKTKQTIWHGVARAVLTDPTTPGQLEGKISEVVAKMLETFPPPKKK